MAATSPRQPASLARQAAVETLSGASGSQRGRFLLVQIPRIHVLGAFLFALVAVLPLAWNVHPLPYTVGQVARTNIRSRVTFQHYDQQELARELKRVENDYPRRYRQVPESDWILHVHGPLWNLVQKAETVKDTKEFLEYTHKKSIKLSPEQARILVQAIQRIKKNYSPFRYIVDPTRRILEEKIYGRGLLSDEDYTRELDRHIQLVDVNGSFRTVRVSRSLKVGGPISVSQVARILDDRLAREMDRLDVEFRETLRVLLVTQMIPSLKFDPESTQQGIEAEKDEVRKRESVIQKGGVLVGKGTPITEKLFDLLRAEDSAFRSLQGWGLTARQFAGKGVLILCIALGFLLYLSRIDENEAKQHQYAVGVALLAGIMVSATQLMIFLGWPDTLLPLGFFVGVVALGMNVRVVMTAVTALVIVLLVILEGRPGTAICFLASGWLFACRVPLIRFRLGFLTNALLCGMLAAVIAVTWGIAMGENPILYPRPENWYDILLGNYLFRHTTAALGGFLISGFGLMLALPVIEAAFGATSNIRLQDLLDQDHPCLKQMVVKAPGTYHHSVIVGTLAEAAAEAIGANALLVKAGAYYHDIGKLMKPEYFSENESGDSRHDALTPSMSALIITAHIKDGSEMAKEYGLPPGVIDMIEQHQGRDLIRFFYRKAQKQEAEGEAVRGEDFRYLGPRPQSREAGIMMLADSVEAASRAMDNPTPSHIRRLVHEIMMERLLDGQFEESGLTLTELHTIEATIVRILVSMYHTRVKYPEAKANERKGKGRK